MSPGTGVILALAAVFLAPAAEELIFRGVLLGWLTRLAIGKTPARADTLAFVGLGDPHEGGPDAPLLEETIVVKWVEGAPSVHPPDGADGRSSRLRTPRPRPRPRSRRPRRSKPGALDPKVVNARLLAANGSPSRSSSPVTACRARSGRPRCRFSSLSLGLGFLYQRTGSIIAPLALTT